MAIADGDIVSLFASNSVGPAPRLRGTIRNIAAAKGDVFWENGDVAMAVSVVDLFKVSFAVPAAAQAFVGQSIKSGAAQEIQGVVLEAYIGESDGGVKFGHLIVLLTGRGQGSPTCFIDSETKPDFSDAPLKFIITTNVYPRY